MMHIISMMNYKGGVGKTTLTANLGAELASRGHSVLLIDMDPQTNLTFSFNTPERWERLSKTRTIKRWFDAHLAGRANVPLLSDLVTPCLKHRISGRIDLIPSHLGLIDVDTELAASSLSGGSRRTQRSNYLRVHRMLADALEDDAINGYDYVIIDCAPNFNIVTKTAIVASDFILVPARPDYLSTLGISYLVRSCNQLVSDYNENVADSPDDEVVAKPIGPRFLGVVFTMTKTYGRAPIAAQRNEIRKTRASVDIPVFDSWIRTADTAFSEALAQKVPVVISGDGWRYEVVGELSQFADEFLERLEGAATA